MNSAVRKLIYEPLASENLRAVVPDFTIETAEGPITAPASLHFSPQGKYVFEMHFLENDVPPSLQNRSTGILGTADRVKITGRIEGELRFSALVFPSSENTVRSRGTATMTIRADRLHLDAEGTDLLSESETRELLGSSSSENERCSPGFSAHLIFHGPNLRLLDSGTKVQRTNDFLGESSSSSFDTHQFAGIGWEAALIQIGKELHLHIRNRKSAEEIVEDPQKLVERIAYAVAFTHGFQPWPVYQEIRVNHRIVERWLSGHLNLGQSTLAPVSERLGFSARMNEEPQLMAIIPRIVDGLGRMPSEHFGSIRQLTWHVLSADLGELPPATQLLIVCSALDGLMKVIGGDQNHTLKEWMSAARATGVSWEEWVSGVMEIRKKHRDNLSHGRLWILEEISNEAYFEDYPQLGGAFMTVIAAYCGYDGSIMLRTPNGAVTRISNLKATRF
jgi:hypothetical protein